MSLLTLPYELRLYIYEVIFDRRIVRNDKTALTLALVCHQLRDEILPLVVADHRYLSSLDRLVKSTGKGTPRMLDMIHDVTLHAIAECLRDIALSRDAWNEMQGSGMLRRLGYSRPSWRHNVDKLEPFTGLWWGERYQMEIDERDAAARLASPGVVSRVERGVLKTAVTLKQRVAEAAGVLSALIAYPFTKSEESRESHGALRSVGDDPRFRKLLDSNFKMTPGDWLCYQFSKKPRMKVGPHSPPYPVVRTAAGRLTTASRPQPVPYDPRPFPPDPYLICAIWDALKSLSQVKTFSLVMKSRRKTSQPLDFVIEQKLLVHMISTACPNITSLSIDSALLPLDYLKNLQNLSALRFSGYSKSTPSETLEIFRSLKQLDTLKLSRHPEHYDKDNFIDTWHLSDYNSVTPEVLENMNPLKCFWISYMSSRVQSEHLTIPMIKALSAHTLSLKELRISSDGLVDHEIFNALLDFIASSKIVDLDVNIRLLKQGYQLRNLDEFFPEGAKYRHYRPDASGFPDTSTNWRAAQMNRDGGFTFQMSTKKDPPFPSRR